jgi:uncharacterized protein
MAARVEPVINENSAAFWTGGALDELRIMRCRACQFWIHPPKANCPSCWSTEIGPEVVSGSGSIWSFTCNRLTAEGDSGEPPIIAEVELFEQPGLCLLTNMVDVALRDVRIGMAVHVQFEQTGDSWIPVFST